MESLPPGIDVRYGHNDHGVLLSLTLGPVLCQGSAPSQVAGLDIGLRSWTVLGWLANPALAKGRAEYSMQMRYRVLGMELLMITIAFAGVFTIWHGMELVGGMVLLGSSALGYLRRGYTKSTLNPDDARL